MAYLMDTNCFIQAKNDYYGFDFCPGFWDWVEQQNKLGSVFSIDKVGDEITRGNDALATWAKQKDSKFFLPLDQAAIANVTRIAAWVTSAKAGYKPQAIPIFMNGADPFLIAFGAAHGHTVVTHETLNLAQRNKIKIPNICNQFGVSHMTIFELLRASGAKFVLN